MPLLRAFSYFFLFSAFATAATGQDTLVSQQLELYGGLARLPFPTLSPSQPFGPTPPDTTVGYFIDADPEQVAYFGVGYRRDWNDGRYLLISIPRLVLGGSRGQNVSRSLNEFRIIRQQFDYLSVRGEFGRRYRTDQPVSFRLGFGLEGIWTQTRNTPDPTANSYYSRYRLLASQLVVTAQAQWDLGKRWRLLSGIDPLAISLGLEERYTENPGLNQNLRTTTTFDLDFTASNHLFIGVAYRLDP